MRTSARLALVMAMLGGVLHPNPSRAQNGTWTNPNGGSWAGATNWSGGTIAAGSGNTANFSTLTLGAAPTITLDGAQTISGLLFGDQGNNYGWTLNTGSGGPLTLGVSSGSPSITVNGQTTTIGAVLAGTAGLTKAGPGTLQLTGAETYTGTTLVSAGTLTLAGASSGGSSASSFSIGGAAGKGVLNYNSSGTWTFATASGSLLVGGAGTASDTGVGAINQTAGTLNLAYSGLYLTLGNVGTASYGSYNQSGGTLTVASGAGIRLGYGGLGSWVQTGGNLSCGRYFSIGGGAATGNGVATFNGGTATINASYRILIPDAAGATAVMNLGTEAGGTASITHLSTTGIDMSDKGGGANGTLNLNSGKILLGGPIFRNNTGGTTTLNLNGGSLQANSGITFIAASLSAVYVYNGGLTLDSQTYSTTVAAPLFGASGNGIYPSGGVFNIASGGGSGFIGAPLVTVSGGSGGGAAAIANVSGGVVTGVTMTCPGTNYQAGDTLSFAFNGGGAATPASTYNYTLQAADIAPNSAGALTKLGTGTLNLNTNSTYAGGTTVSAGTLNVKTDGGLGLGNVVVAGNATLTLGGGVTNGYLAPTANLVLNATSTNNLNFTGINVINGLSLNGGLTYATPGTYGAVGSAAASQASQFIGTGILQVTATPVGALVTVGSSANPSLVGQTVTFSATVSGSGPTPTGTVTFKSGTVTLGTLALNGSGAASLPITFSSVGADSITAIYSGNSTYTSATSLPVVQVVNPRLDLWTGAHSGIWDITTTTNWSLLGSPVIYHEGDQVQFDDTAAGTTALALGVSVNPNAVLFTNNTRNYSLSGTGAIAGSAGLTLSGAGSLTLSNANTFTGPTVLQNGTLSFSGTGASTGNGSLAVGDAVGTAVLNMNSSGTLNYSGSVPVGGFTSDTGDTSSGAINQTAGSVNIGSSSSYLELGAGGPTAYGAYNLSGGALNTVNTSGLRVGSLGLGSFLQSGGSLNVSRYLALGTITGSGVNGGNGVATFTGGTAAISTSYRVILGDKPGGLAVMNIGTQAGGNATLSASTIEFLDNAAASLGVLNLNSGTVNLIRSIYKNTVNSVGVDLLNLNGATLQDGANNIALIDPSVDGILLYNGGLVIDTGTNTDTESVSLQPAAGNGIYPARGTIAITTGGGSGYIGAPLVTVSGGSGANATAIANVSGGVVTGVTLTCPGTNYAVGDSLSFTFAGGGCTTPAGGFNYTLKSGDVAPNTAGGLTKIGSGTLTLQGASFYTGNTVVGAGALVVAVDGGLGAGNVLVGAGAVLTLQGGVTNGYLSPTANLALDASAAANLDFSGTNAINGLSLNGGLTYVAPGTYGAVGSGASHEDPHFTGTGFLTVTTTPAGGAVVTLTSSTNPSAVGQFVTFTATVAGAIGTPTGAITLSDGALTLGTTNLSAGVAHWTTAFSTVGSHPISATYAGNPSYASTFSSLIQTVNPRLDIWTGAHNNHWDISTSTNWLLQGLPSVYDDGDQVQFDDSATGSTAVTLGATINPIEVLFTNNTKTYSLSGSGSISGVAGVTLGGTATVIVSNANSYGGPTRIQAGALTFAGAGASTGNGTLAVGDGAGSAVLNMNSSGTLDFSGYVPVGGLSGDASDTGSGAIYQSAGTVNLGSGSTYLELGAGGPAAYGYYNLSGGALNTLNASGIRVGAIGQGVFVQTGGVLTLSRWLALGSYSGAAGNGGSGEADFLGGTASVTPSYQVILGDKPGGVGVLNIGTEAGGNATLSALYTTGPNGGVIFLKDGSASQAVLNLNRGTLSLAGSVYKNSGNLGGTDLLNLNGGTLQAAANNMTLISATIDAVLLYNGGVVFDTQTNTDTETVNLQSATGSGIYPAGGTLAITSGGGTGYLGAPQVAISGGSGANATAIASVSGGVVTGVILTCPGTNYQAGDLLSFWFTGGGTTDPAAAFNYTLQAADVAPNNTGGVSKAGAGTLILSGVNTYIANTVVSNGTLEVDGTLAGGVVVAGGTLDGSGVVGGAVTVPSAGTLSAGSATVIGQLTITSTLSLAGLASLRIDKTAGVSTSDNVQGLSSLSYGGALVVTNTTSDHTELVAGDKFTLFSAASYTGTFASVTLPPLPVGLGWNTADLTADGSIKVVAANLTPPAIVHTLSSARLTLSWPADHIGWRLLVQTNNLATGVSKILTDWGTVTGSAATNLVSLPVDPAKPTEFYRLVYP